MDLRASMLQMCSGSDVSKNLEFIKQSISDMEHGVDLLLLPECALHFALNGHRHIFDLNESSELKELQLLAQEKDFHILLGGQAVAEDSVDVDSGESSVYNSVIHFDPSRTAPQVVYRKVHLFNIDLQGCSARENSFYKAGNQPAILDIKGWKVGVGICFDLRFPTLSAYYFQMHVDALVFPAAFLEKTGRSHWFPLLTARAIETQAYTLAAAQCGVHHGDAEQPIHTHGHSLAVSPWGQILCDQKSNLGLLYVTLQKEEVQKVRSGIPMQRDVVF